MSAELESDLRDTVEWGKRWQITFNAGKTHLVSFHHWVNSGNIGIRMGEKMLEEESSFRMLGLSITSKLDWSTYISLIAKAAFQKDWCSLSINEISLVLYLYKSTIRPCMEYCCPCLGWCS